MQIPRQLYNEGGISSVPLRRENFGLGSWIKEKVRKIIPKEVAQVAVKAAPFVAPFNPAIAGAMSGLGTFQQTGRMGKSLTAGALNYGGGQAARYLGGAGFQGNPFAGGTGAFTPSGFMGGFSSPFGTETGLGKFLQDRRVARQGINIDKGRGSTLGQTYRQPGQQMSRQLMDPTMMPNQLGSPPLIDAADAGTYFPRSVENVAAMENAYTLPSQQITTAQDFQKKAISDVLRNADANTIDELTNIGKGVVEKLPKGLAETSQKATGEGFLDQVKNLIPGENFDFTKAGETVKNLGGKALNAIFRDAEGNLDKTAILAALVTVPTFFEARALADEAGIGADEFTEEMFTAAKADSKKTYESNLGSFFTGTGYTGNLAKGGLIRRNYTFGSDPDEYPETGDDITIFEIMKEQGIPVGEQVKGKIDAGAKPIRMEVADLSANDIKLIKYGKKHGLTTPKEIREILGESFNKEKPPTNEEIQGVLEGTVTKPTGIFAAKGGRIGFDRGGNEDINFIHRNKLRKAIEDAEKMGFDMNEVTEDASEYNGKGLHSLTQLFKNKKIRKALINEGHNPDKIMREFLVEQMKSETGDLPSDSRGYSEFFRKGGRVKYALGTPPAGEGGLGGLPVEADMRYTGGFMPYGEKEKADDVPARLSKNEFVFTADAVRAAGGGSMQKGAQRMYNTMKMLEGQLR